MTLTSRSKAAGQTTVSSRFYLFVVTVESKEGLIFLNII